MNEKELRGEDKQDRLIEADRHKIMREAQIRTALEEPDFAQKEFEKWQVIEGDRLERERNRETLMTGWAKVAWLAEGRMHAMGRELDKLQKRIGRQRKSNREQNKALKESEAEVAYLREKEAEVSAVLQLVEYALDEFAPGWEDTKFGGSIQMRIRSLLSGGAEESPKREREGSE